MDAARKVKGLNKRGSILILVAVSILVFIAIAGLAIDLAYMYANKAQLQKAADAGALAGAARLDSVPPAVYVNQTGARNAAVHMGAANFNLTLSANSTNDPSGDVLLGHWDSATKFTPSGVPVNAVKVVARRTGVSDNAQGTIIGTNTPFNLFFGGVSGHSTMGAAASAVAWLPPAARSYLLVKSDICNPGTTFPYTMSPSKKDNDSMAWTSLSSTVPASDANIKQLFFCPATPPNIDVCGQTILTSNGTSDDDFNSISVDFYDPNYDAKDKTFNSDGSVATWSLLVPYAQPGTDPTNSPAIVSGYAQITIIRTCSDNGNPCNGRTSYAPSGKSDPCAGGEHDVVISSATCFPCGSGPNGAWPVLAQ